MSYNKQGRKIIKILRHNLDTINHTEEGYVLVKDLIRKVNGLTFDNVNKIVSTNNKNRFDLIEKNNKLYIRASQGHSSGNLNDEIMMERITEPLKGCYHGTYTNKLELIKTNGLSRMSRRHIHIVEFEDAISGIRASCNVKIYVNIESALEDGIKFYRSSNGVILTPGNDNGFLDPKYFLDIVYI